MYVLWNTNMNESLNYICHLCVIKKDLLDKVGYFDSKFDGAQDYDLFLRVTEQTNKIVHIPKVLYHWRVHNNSTSKNMNSKIYGLEAGKRAIEEHCKRMNFQIKYVKNEQPLGLYRVKYELKNSPLVSIIILMMLYLLIKMKKIKLIILIRYKYI